MKTERWVVRQSSKLPNALAEHQSLNLPSLKQARRLIESGRCSVNGRVRTFASAHVVPGDQIEVILEQQEKASSRCEIIFEDQWLFVVNKPAGLVVEQEAMEKALQRPCRLVHRLDKETSGLLIVAKDEKTALALEDLFRERRVQKEYIAIVDGKVSRSKGTISLPIGSKKMGSGAVVCGVEEDGKKAQTDYVRLKDTLFASLLLVRPHTGRTHQIRVHLAHIGHPILGDYRYGERFVCEERPTRHMLHAWKVRITHPETRCECDWIAPLPEEMERVIKKLFRVDQCVF